LKSIRNSTWRIRTFIDRIFISAAVGAVDCIMKLQLYAKSAPLQTKTQNIVDPMNSRPLRVELPAAVVLTRESP
jgi:hypothetical protein